MWDVRDDIHCTGTVSVILEVRRQYVGMLQSGASVTIAGL